MNVCLAFQLFGSPLAHLHSYNSGLPVSRVIDGTSSFVFIGLSNKGRVSLQNINVALPLNERNIPSDTVCIVPRSVSIVSRLQNKKANFRPFV